MFSPVLINVSLSSRSNHTPYNMSVFVLSSFAYFPVDIFLGAVIFL